MKKRKRITYLLTGSFAVNILKYDFVFLDNVLKFFLLFYEIEMTGTIQLHAS